MQRLTHIVFSLLIFSLFFYIFKLDLGLTVFCAFGAFFPDIDFLIDKKWLSKGHPVKEVWRSFMHTGMHRTTFHNIWVMVISTIGIGILFKDVLYAFVFAIGFLSHLVLDSMTITGIYWLYPYRKRFHYKGPISTGSEKERLIQIALVILTGLIFAFGLGIFA